MGKKRRSKLICGPDDYGHFSLKRIYKLSEDEASGYR